ncbi:hypothetical protein F5Y02DRAFT_147845 [Annulohypoxylon stygium]|nr:hypothetical protein F5Y02DRAFT_147845 [Annulohypoxylon stygium]
MKSMSFEFISLLAYISSMTIIESFYLTDESPKNHLRIACKLMTLIMIALLLPIAS